MMSGISVETLRAEITAAAVESRLRSWNPLGSWTHFRGKTLSRIRLKLPEAESLPDGSLRFVLRSPERRFNHIRISFPAKRDECFVGFGERFNAVDQRGWRLENWTDEGAVGLGERLSPLLTRLGVSWNPFPKGPTTAYKPIPWFLSSRGYGALLSTSAPIFFDVARSDKSRVSCEAAARELEVVLFFGKTPAEILEKMTARTGRPKGLPDWALAPWNDAVGGQDEVRRVARLLRDEKIPSSVIWTEDWQFGKWVAPGKPRGLYVIFPVVRTPDRSLYPDIEKLARELHEGGFRFLSYYLPYLAATDPDYRMAKKKGYLLQNARGVAAHFPMIAALASDPKAVTCVQVDLTNPEARRWYKEELRRGVRLGFDGWMADFGEYTPVNSVTASGESGLLHHNRFPKLWSELNRELLEEERPDGDFVYFSRSASLGQQSVSPVFWSGDSNTDFERWDGLPSNLRGLLSAGLSGLSIWTSDVGGYMSVSTRARDEETLARWTEFSAFLAVMRTHHGTHPGRSVQFDHSPTSLDHFRAYARLHTALFPLRRQLVDEAARTGLPVCRALLLHYPQDEDSWKVEDQFLLGPHLLVAPVLERGAKGREVYLPPGHRWIGLWDARAHEGGGRIRAEAPLGVVPIFLRTDGVLATFDTFAHTLLRREKVADPTLRTLDDAERSLSIFVGPEFSGEAVLYDGTRIESAAGAGANAAALEPARPHELLPAGILEHWQPLGAVQAKSAVIAWDKGFLRVESPIERRITICEMRHPLKGRKP